MIKTIAWLIKCRHVLLKRDNSSILVTKVNKQADKIFIIMYNTKHILMISGLPNDQSLLKCSNLRCLMPRLDDEG